jgi:hypothetical protein
MRLSFKQRLLTASLVVAATAAQAQELPVPGEKNPDWKLQKTEEPYPQAYPSGSKESPAPIAMPSPRIQGGMLNEQGEYDIFFDSSKGVRYDLTALKEQGTVRVRNMRTGTEYTYARRKSIPKQ